MKRIFTLLLLSTIFTSSFAQREDDRDDDDRRSQDEQYNKRNNGAYNNGVYNNNQNSSLVVNGYSQNRIYVKIDNLDYQTNGNNGTGNVVNIPTLQPGNHTIIIYELKKGFFGNQKQQQIYNAVLYFKPGVQTSMNINSNGQVSISENQLFNNNGNGVGYGYGRKKKKYKRYDDDNHGHYPNQYPNQYPNNYPSQYPGNARPMSEYDFGMLKQYVRKESFDERRSNIAKQAANTSYFSTAQVRDLMSLLSFEDNKLDLAKFFYSKTIDKNNYYQLTDALNFSSNKDALLEYIKRTR